MHFRHHNEGGEMYSRALLWALQNNNLGDILLNNWYIRNDFHPGNIL